MQDFPRLAKWAITGCLTVALDVSLFRVAYAAAGTVFLANAFTMPLSAAFNYLMHHRWSFQSSRSHAAATPRFVGNLIFNYVLNSSLVSMAIWCGLPPIFAKLAAVAIQAPASFMILNRWVFNSTATVSG